MIKPGPAGDANQGKRKAYPRAILPVMGQPAAWNLLNETLPQNKNKSSYLLQLDPLELVYEGKTTNQTENRKGRSRLFSIRGFRRFLRQRFLVDMQEKGSEPCQPLSDEHYFSAQVS